MADDVDAALELKTQESMGIHDNRNVANACSIFGELIDSREELLARPVHGDDPTDTNSDRTMLERLPETRKAGTALVVVDTFRKSAPQPRGKNRVAKEEPETPILNFLLEEEVSIAEDSELAIVISRILQALGHLQHINPSV